MPAKLFTRSLAESEEQLEFQIEGAATIGRGAGNDVVLPFDLVSSEHARIRFDAQSACYFLEDLGSLNGTRLDGARVEAPERLGSLHVITFAGIHDFVFKDVAKIAMRHGGGEPPPVGEDLETLDAAPVTPIEEAPEGAEALAGSPPPPDSTRVDKRPAMELPAALAEQVSAAGPEQTHVESAAVLLPAALGARADGATPFPTPSGEEPAAAEPPAAEPSPPARGCLLEVQGDTGAPQRIELGVGEWLIGRSSKCDVRIRSQGVSRRHARLTIRPDRVTVCDLGSRNHTYLGGKVVEGECEVEVGERLTFGKAEARLLATR